ncbi:MAG: hypothetical protein Q8N35_01300 [Methylococcaceae bacterium]|nr:hypothetical protein [Methylococcaceae bacterium]MDZ4156485.1 hypothetical protein [Methylococcales bacterium]MDP2391701.1 hypothetical protein [Methylococcaceae bacterium]MDP3018201.1 hypothetical protein [Methylococcaceae bacterium]MDP3389413.1 hypothetical protein [Methylococcaceae bacterium]
MITLYGIKNCDTVKKARLWLDNNGIAYRFHDYRSDGLSPELVKTLPINSAGTRCLTAAAPVGGNLVPSNKPILMPIKPSH